LKPNGACTTRPARQPHRPGLGGDDRGFEVRDDPRCHRQHPGGAAEVDRLDPVIEHDAEARRGVPIPHGSLADPRWRTRSMRLWRRIAMNYRFINAVLRNWHAPCSQDAEKMLKICPPEPDHAEMPHGQHPDPD
jgi:hypothetical protein